MEIYPVVMAGGTGTRFWPASRSNLPKQFLDIIGSKTMIEQTIERVSPVCREENVIIVGNEAHHVLLKKISGKRRFVILEEPFGRNTAPCIGFAAIYLRKHGVVDEPMAVLPADHFIIDQERFRRILSIGGRLARKGSIVTIGIVPTRPEAGYGYLRKGPAQDEIEGVEVYNIEQFVEKPGEEDALRYTESKDYFWNSGIFIFTPETILEEIQLHLPEVYEGLLKIEEGMGERNYQEVLRSVYQEFPSISIDYGVMEKTAHSVFAIPGDFGWSDVGSWESLYELRKKETDDNKNLVHGKNLLFDTKSCFVFNKSKQIVVGLGIEDLVIVNTDDVILVADIKKSQDIKKIIEEIKRKGLTLIL
ncbi:MAG: mannose-1-phosphate guanylyltransferase [Deltaproteobacteria bacterium]|nr:mannose-1-phosphate guanylyltransferase [Deltaproteobacteria bacterium]